MWGERNFCGGYDNGAITKKLKKSIYSFVNCSFKLISNMFYLAVET